MSVSVLLSGFGSWVLPVTAAVLRRVVGTAWSLGIVTRRVMSGKEAPGARVSVPSLRVQETAEPVAEQVQPVPVAPA